MSLVAHWPLNGHARDIVGGRDAYEVGGSGISWQGSPIGRGLNFSQTDDHVYIPHDEQINDMFFGKSKKFSISFFYHPQGFTDYGCIIQKALAGSWSNSTTGVWAYSGGIRFVMGCNVSGNPTGGSIHLISKPPLNQWVHVSCIADGESMYIYLNGKLVGTTTAGKGSGSKRGIIIGSNIEDYINNVTGSTFDGRIEDVHILKGPVGEKHIKTDYQRFKKRGRTLTFDKQNKNVYQLVER